jgi:hypothetical protein
VLEGVPYLNRQAESAETAVGLDTDGRQTQSRRLDPHRKVTNLSRAAQNGTS